MFSFLDADLLAFNVLVMALTVVVMVDQARTVDGVSNAFGGALETSSERVIVTVLVVVAHITFVPWGVYGRTRSSLGDANFGFSGRELGGRTSELGRFLAVGLLGNVETILGGAFSELTLGDV
jgi:hypothetical protein